VPMKSCSKAKQWLADMLLRAINQALNGVNDDNEDAGDQRCSVCNNIASVRFAISLGMLLGMSHGWVTAESRARNESATFEIVRTVKSATGFSPFSSGEHQLFPY
jgi:hypothetical protein